MIKNFLKELKMTGAVNALERLNTIEDRDEFLKALLQAEWEDRKMRANKRRLERARFPLDKEWSDIDSSLNPEIDFKGVRALIDSNFVEKRENLCLMGQQGTGKTHSLIALGRDLCRKGTSTLFYTACELVNTLEEAKAQCCLSKVMQKIMKPSLLIIDELGFVPFSEVGARLLFDVFAGRYERGSIAISTNLSFEKWIQIFGSIELTGALLDRFTHRAHIFKYKGQSARFSQAMRGEASEVPPESHIKSKKGRVKCHT
jgi:DNA replication protein DnaC